MLRGRVDSGTSEGVAPQWAKYAIVTFDMGLYTIHWEIDAWDDQLVSPHVARVGKASVLRSGELEMSEVSRQKDLVAARIRQTVERLRAVFEDGIIFQDGTVLRPTIICPDVGGTARLSDRRVWAWYEEILSICTEYGDRWVPMRGRPWDGRIADRCGGRNWIIEKKDNPHKRVDANADHYKLKVFDSFDIPAIDARGARSPGARTFFSGIPTAYMLHQTSEKLEQRIADGKPIDRSFASSFMPRGKKEGGYSQNHWFDTSWMQFCAADLIRHHRRDGSRRDMRASPPPTNRSPARRRY